MNALGTHKLRKLLALHWGQGRESALRRAAVFVFFSALMGLMGAMPGRAAGSQLLHNRVPAAVSKLTALGHLSSSQHLHLSISLPLRNQQALTALLQQISDPTSPNYRHYLTPAQFTAQFGPSQSDYQAVINFANAQGLKVRGTHANRLLVDIDGSVPNIEKAFHVKMLNYQHPTEARTFYAANSAPSVDLNVPILDIIGLDNYTRPHPNCKLRPGSIKPAANITFKAKSQAAPYVGTGTAGSYAGGDFRAAYVPGTTLTGTGQSIAMVEFDAYYASDITAYETQFGLPNVPQTVIPIDGGVSMPGSSDDEVSLDIEMAIAMAPGLSNVYVYEAPSATDWDTMLNRIATDDVAKQVSCSWGGGGPDSTAEGIFKEMAAQGQSFLAASGDSGAYTNGIVFPCDSPSITVVGGTELTTTGTGGSSSGSYTSETVWSNGPGDGSGGGISTTYAIPSYQQGVSMSTNYGSTTMRNIPDVAMVGYSVFIDYGNGGSAVVDGTSCAAPLWAGFIALTNQQAAATSGESVGFINPAIYTIGQGSSYALDFHDITTGNNGTSTQFPAVIGYDLCTGWGSPLGTNMINALAGTLVPVITTTSPLQSGDVGASYSQTFTATSGTSPYTWSLSSGNLPSGLSLSSAGVLSGTPSATGTATFTVKVTDSKGANSSTAFTLTTYAQGTPIITTASPLPSEIEYSTYTETLTASGGTAPLAWSIASGALPSGLSLSSAGVISGAPSALGTSSFTVQVTGNNGLASTASFSLTVLPQPPGINSSLTVSAIEGQPFSYQITASNNPTSFGATGLPTGLYVIPSTGMILGTPTVIGTFAATITATNSGGTGTSTLNITIFSPAPVISVPLTTVSSFVDATGEASNSGVILATDGNFYGTTPIAGANNLGTVFKMTPSGSLTALTSFTGTNANYSTAPLVQYTDGTLYGTSVYGGTSSTGSIQNDGTVFKINTSGSLTTLATFNYTNGAHPYDGLILGTDGNFYGTTYLGGANYEGTVFKITPSGSLTTLTSFTGTNGLYPYGSLIQATDGNFYGTTYGGGSGNAGTVFKMTPTGSVTTLCAFTGTGSSPESPEAGVVQGKDGNFYGTSYDGGTAGEGTVFKVTPTGSVTTLASFLGDSNGDSPNAALIQGADGNFYGTTVYGGDNDYGTLFEITPTGSLTTLYSFSGTDGEFPYCPLTYYSDGKFYGTTSSGGPNSSIDCGTVFKFTPFFINVTVGGTVSYQINASNTPSNYGASGLPPGLSINTSTGLISGTATTMGTYPVALSATNPAGSGTATLTINVVPLPPVITNTVLTATGEVGGAFNYGITATNSPTSYGASGLPTGLSVNTTTGVISGTPTVTGTFSSTISATNSGGTGSATLAITVQPGPTIAITSPGTNTVGLPNIANSLVLTASASSAVATPTVTWSKVSGPGTVTFGSATAASTYATFSSTGTYVLSATANDGFASASANLTVGAGTSISTTGTTVVDQLAFSGLLGDGAASTGTIGGTVWTSLASAESGTTTVTTSTATPLLNLKTSSNTSSGIQFTWTNSFAFQSSGNGDNGTSSSGTATDGLSTYTATSTSPTAGVTFTNGGEFFPWNVMKAYNAVHDATDGYASFKLSSSTPLSYTFWIASSFDHNNPSSTAWPTLINIGGTYSQSGAKFTGGTTLTLQGSQSQSADNSQRYAIGALTTSGGFTSTYNPATGLYDLNVQIGSGINSTSSGAALNGIIFQASQTFTANNAPQVNPGTVSNPAPGTGQSLVGTASDDGLPTGSSLATTWTASGPASVSIANASSPSTSVTFPQGGTYVLTLAGTDGSATVFQNLTVSVPFIPVIQSGSSLGVATTGSSFSFQVVANDTPTSYSATGLPAGLSINTSTGLISGTPTVSGTFNVTVYATNSSGTGSQTMTLTVNAASPATDTPTLPQWALILLGAVLFAGAIRGLPGARQA